MVAPSSRRVVVTGLGVVSPLGLSGETLWERLVAGDSGVAEITSIPTAQLPIHHGGEAREFTEEIDQFGPLEKEQKRNIKKGLKLMCREIAMGVAAAQLALHHSGLAGKTDSERTGVCFGSDHLLTRPEEFAQGVKECLDEHQQFDFSRWAEQGLKQVDPLWLLKYLPNMPSSHIAIYNDFHGPSNSITLREASSNLSIAEAYCTIVRGGAEVMVAGATGTRIHPLRTIHVVMQEEVARNGRPAPQLSRPFDRDRTGMVLAEGAGAVILENLEHALARGATIYGELIGHGASTVMDPRGNANCRKALENSIRAALRSSGLTPEQIGHVNAHGVATRQGDIAEAQAIHSLFGERRTAVPVVAAKSNMGNVGAGGGTIELIASLMALRAGHLFPTLNYETADPECPIAVTRSGDVPAGESAINLSVTPQGQAAAVVARRWQS